MSEHTKNEPGPCPAGVGDHCHPRIATYGTTAASLGDYNGKLGDSAFEAYLARCLRCGAVFAGLAPGGVFADEDGFEDRVLWVPMPEARTDGDR